MQGPLKKILIADDEALIVMNLEESLQRRGFEISGICGDAQSAVNMARELKPDLVVMDIVMPGEKDGIEACEIIQEELDIPVILLTAYGGEGNIKRAQHASPSALLMKPCESDHLALAIQVALDQ